MLEGLSAAHARITETRDRIDSLRRLSRVAVGAPPSFPDALDRARDAPTGDGALAEPARAQQGAPNPFASLGAGAMVSPLTGLAIDQSLLNLAGLSGGVDVLSRLTGALATGGTTGWSAYLRGAGAPSQTLTATVDHAVSGAMRGSEIPAELRAYGNGRLPSGQLAEIGVGSHRLAPRAAEGFKLLRAAAAADGVEIGVTDSYRSYAAQVDVARRKGLYSQGGLAAKPGTSKHGWGLALDLKLDGEALAWMRANANRFGFVEDTPRETWHWTYYGYANA